MSRLPLAGVSISPNSTIPTPSSRRLSSTTDLRKRRTISENTPPVPRPSKSIVKARSRSFIEDPSPPPPNNQQPQQLHMVSRNSMTTSPRPLTRQQSNGSVVKSQQTLYLDDRVVVDSLGVVGTLKFLGETEFKEGYWAGIQLDILGSGKNDGSVKGIRYFSCPPQTGLFVLASKVTALDTDSDSIRSLSPPMMSIQQANMHHIGSRTVRYSPSSPPRKNTTTTTTSNHRAPPLSTTTTPIRYSYQQQAALLQTPLTSPTSTTAPRHGLRRSQPTLQSPTPSFSHYNNHGSIPSPAMTPTSHSLQDMNNDYYYYYNNNDGTTTTMATDEMLITETPMPDDMVHSKSLTTQTDSNESLQETTTHGQDDVMMLMQRFQQLQLRMEVLEAENKFLKLENTTDPTPQGQDMSPVVKDERMKRQDADDLRKAREEIEELQERVQRLETEQAQLTTERDQAMLETETTRKEKTQMEQEMQELEKRLAEVERTAETNERRWTEKVKSMQPTPQFFQTTETSDDRQMKLEMELEEVHEKMNSLHEAARAKDALMLTLTAQIEQHRNMVEEKEREMRRIKADSDRHVREKDRVLTELKELETKWLAHQDCASQESFDRLRKDLATVKENYARESAVVLEYRERNSELQKTVDELKLAGIESIELYQSSVEMNRVDLAALNAALDDERRKVAALENECEELRKVGLDAIKAYEGLKRDRQLSSSSSPSIEHNNNVEQPTS
ncbi:MAG: hypothetical protein EXX96DRAFT_563759 [Benjaminiella poitrasii]|nr:MAG: hypothetical protein EXX96DRAFT_563759 [Benjaminiella poitrasii]